MEHVRSPKAGFNRWDSSLRSRVYLDYHVYQRPVVNNYPESYSQLTFQKASRDFGIRPWCAEVSPELYI
jgi:hypothetical protein